MLHTPSLLRAGEGGNEALASLTTKFLFIKTQVKMRILFSSPI